MRFLAFDPGKSNAHTRVRQEPGGAPATAARSLLCRLTLLAIAARLASSIIRQDRAHRQRQGRA